MDELLAEIERLPEEWNNDDPTHTLETPLYTVPQMTAHARRIASLALETAARECEEKVDEKAGGYHYRYRPKSADECAALEKPHE
jgi:hypothetical protein